MRTSNFNARFKRRVPLLLTAGMLLFSVIAASAQSTRPDDDLSRAEQNSTQAAKTATETAVVKTRYTFTGKGSWFTAANWENERVPPAVLQAGEQVVVNGTGPCMYGQPSPFTFGEGSSVEVMKGNTLYISIGDNFIQKGGILTNNGVIKIVSGNFRAGDEPTSKIVNNGNIEGPKLSVIDKRIQEVPATPHFIPFATRKQNP